MSNNLWTADPRLNAIPENKRNFLITLIQDINHLSENEKLPFLMALISSNKLNQISFTSQELNLCIQVMKDYTDEKQIQKVNNILNILTN